MTASIPVGAYLLISGLAVAVGLLGLVVVRLLWLLSRAEGARDQALHEKHMHESEAKRLRRLHRFRDRGVWVPVDDEEPEIDGRVAHH